RLRFRPREVQRLRVRLRHRAHAHVPPQRRGHARHRRGGRALHPSVRDGDLMRVPLSWLREYVDLPATETGRDVQAKLISAGLEVETVEHLGADLKGPLVVGQVLTIEELEGFKKPIRFCTVDVGRANGTGEPQEIVCGARNFAVGDKVVVVLPGAVLPGDFKIAARKTYGKTSHGMICSSDELGMGDDGTKGIIVLPPETEVGKDAIELLELVDEVLDIAVTANRGDCLSIRGVAR